MTDQRFGHGRFIVFCREQLGCRLILGALDVHAVQIEAVQFVHGLFVKLFGQDDLHTAARFDLTPMPQGLVQVFAHAIAHCLRIHKLRGIETVQVQLERFAFNDVRAFCGHCDVRQRHLGLAL